MSSNKIEYSHKGQTYGLLFNIGTYRHVGEITGLDPLKFMPESDNFSDIVSFTKVVFKAALLNNGHNLDDNLIEEIYGSLNVTDLTRITNAHTRPLESSLPKQGVGAEANGHTQ